MAKGSIPSVTSDFDGVIAYLAAHHAIPKAPSQSLLTSARRIHRSTYSLILWRFRVGNLEEHGRVFLEEIASDALQILPQTLAGYVKTAKLLTRGIVENTLRHIYFSDHPVEFARLNRDRKWYMRIEDLFSYVPTHPAFLEVLKKFDALDRLRNVYAELSVGIHGRRVADLEMRAALNKIHFDAQAAAAQAKMVERCAEAVNFVLTVFHRDRVRAMATEDRRIILHTMPKPARRVWNESE